MNHLNKGHGGDTKFPKVLGTKKEKGIGIRRPSEVASIAELAELAGLAETCGKETNINL